jgi:hypothetical protein
MAVNLPSVPIDDTRILGVRFGEERFQNGGQLRNQLGCCKPHDAAIHNLAAVDQDVPHPDDPVDIRDTFCKSRVDPSKLAQRFANQLSRLPRPQDLRRGSPKA